MKNVPVRYDSKNMLGLTTPSMTTIFKEVQNQAFMDLPGDQYLQHCSEKAATQFKQKCTDLVVLGIGGSDLGARAMYESLGSEKIRIHFAGSSTDPGSIAPLLKNLDFKKTYVNVISKSGGTLETMSAFLVLRDRLIKTVGKTKYPEHIIATTDPETGSLYELAMHENYAMLPIPPGVGGRFSVLSPVGLFPAYMMGLNVSQLSKGATSIIEHPKDALQFAGLHFIAMHKRKQNIHVTMPYSHRMHEFTAWVRQLVAESLGKNGKGPTPGAATGPEDQHSQLQLWSDGPNDKVITFIEIESFNAEVTTPRVNLTDNTLRQFSNRSFSDLIHLERYATAESLRKDKRPNGTIFIKSLDEYALGGLLMFYQIAVAAMGELMGINAYNQPGVEQSKKIIRRGLR